MSPETNTDAEFAYGAGHLNPAKAGDPGLVYEAGEADYVRFLCGQGYNTTLLRLVTGDQTCTCSKSSNGTVWDLNYPSLALSVKSKSAQITRVFRRTVINVGSPAATYKARVVAPQGLKVTVSPDVLEFKAVGQQQSFTVTVGGKVEGKVASGYLMWLDGVHEVKSPIVASYYSS